MSTGTTDGDSGAAAVVSPPTLDTVARAAGVSRQTVSNALQRPERLRPETRERVLGVIADLGYRPFAPARQLATRRTMAIAVPVHRPTPDGVSGLVLDAFLHSLAESGRVTGHRIVLYPGGETGQVGAVGGGGVPAGDDEEILELDDLLAGGHADSVILTGTHSGDRRVAWLRQRRCVFCTFGRPWLPDGRVAPAHHDWADVDGADGCAQAVRYLAAGGARRIGFIGWPPGSGTGDDRRAGWAREAQRLGVAAPEVSLACVDDAAAAQSLVAGVLDGNPATRPDAVVCASDTLALGAWRASRAASSRVPDLAVVGFDATPVATALGLASLAQPVAEAARACLAFVVERLGGADLPARGVLLPPRLVLPRDSRFPDPSGPPPHHPDEGVTPS